MEDNDLENGKCGVVLERIVIFMDTINAEFAAKLLFKDPLNGEELRLKYEPQDNGDGSFSLYVTNSDGSRNWKHTITTEEI